MPDSNIHLSAKIVTLSIIDFLIQIIPTILTNNINEVKEKLQKLKEVTNFVHLDIMDGKFVNNKTVTLNDLTSLKQLRNFKIGCHLMVVDPIKQIKIAQKIGCQEITAQIEKMADQKAFVDKVLQNRMKVGLALDFATNLLEIEKNLFSKLDTVLIMLVKAGFGGQELNRERLKLAVSLSKLRQKKKYHFKIGADGGINKDTIWDCVKAGVEVLSIGSAFWQNNNLKRNFKKLMALAKKNCA